LQADVSLEAREEIVHDLWVSLHNLAVLGVVGAVSPLDGVEDFEALVKSLVQHHVVDGLFHLIHFFGELVLLTRRDVIVVIAALSQLHLEILLRLLQFFLVLVKLGCVVLEELDDSSRNLLHAEVVLL